jgi:homoserine kinase
MSPVALFAPASIGNFAAGFDVLGMAVRPLEGTPLGDIVEAEAAAIDELVLVGPFADRIACSPEENLVSRARRAFAQRLGEPLPPVRLTLHKQLPIASGLGSSAASAVAAAAALNHFLGQPLDDEALLAVAGEAEGATAGFPHLDNVAPSLLGGLRLICSDGRARRLPFPAELQLVLFLPELALPTREARAVLPPTVPLTTAAHHAGNLASLIEALHRGDLGLLAAALHDPLAEPFREHLVPGLAQVRNATRAAGALGCALSGAGPAVFAVTEPSQGEAVGEAGARAWRDAGVTCQVRVCALDPEGARRVA